MMRISVDPSASAGHSAINQEAMGLSLGLLADRIGFRYPTDADSD